MCYIKGMLNHKEINKDIESLLGIEPTYGVYKELRKGFTGLTLSEAKDDIAAWPEDEQHLFSIISDPAAKYSEDVTLALSAVNKVLERDGYKHIFVLSFEDGSWKASFGDYYDCTTYSGGNPAYCTCMALLQFMGKY